MDLTVPGDEAPAPDAVAPAEAFEHITCLLAERMSEALPLVICWKQPWSVREGLLRLLVADLPYPQAYGPDGFDREADRIRTHTLAVAVQRAEPHPWLTNAQWTDLQPEYVRFHAKPSGSTLGPDNFQPDWRVNPLDGFDHAGDAVHGLRRLLQSIASVRQDAVSPHAPWCTHPAALDGLDEDNPKEAPTI